MMETANKYEIAYTSTFINIEEEEEEEEKEEESKEEKRGTKRIRLDKLLVPMEAVIEDIKNNIVEEHVEDYLDSIEKEANEKGVLQSSLFKIEIEEFAQKSMLDNMVMENCLKHVENMEGIVNKELLQKGPKIVIQSSLLSIKHLLMDHLKFNRAYLKSFDERRKLKKKNLETS